MEMEGYFQPMEKLLFAYSAVKKLNTISLGERLSTYLYKDLLSYSSKMVSTFSHHLNEVKQKSNQLLKTDCMVY